MTFIQFACLHAHVHMWLYGKNPTWDLHAICAMHAFSTVQPWLSKLRLSEPSIIQTLDQSKSAGQSTNIRYDIDMCPRSSVQNSYARSYELETLK